MAGQLRIRQLNQCSPRRGDYVLYWMVANRRPTFNFSLDHALHWCEQLQKPLLVFEALRMDYRWASDRHHAFVMAGMAANRAAFAGKTAYFPYVEPERNVAKGLLRAVAEKACVVVTDEFPCFFLPQMIEAAGNKLPVLLEAVDSNGVVPLAACDTEFSSAYAFRRFLHRELPNHLGEPPRARPFSGRDLPLLKTLPESVTRRFPPLSSETLAKPQTLLASLDIDHEVAPIAGAGGHHKAREVWRCFVRERLEDYAQHSNDPDAAVTSGLSPYLHFGHISTHEVLADIQLHYDWSPEQINHDVQSGKRQGWWNLSPSLESFLDQLVTWRELGYQFCHKRRDYDRFSSLPDWARETLERHEDDPREHRYTLNTFEQAKTHNDLWNAAQNQLRQQGTIHNYLRMLWGKKILEWSFSPKHALRVMIELNNKYALDGRNPNSYSGIFWTLGRFDRPWGPERDIFGKIRYMTAKNTARKVNVTRYLDRFLPSRAGSRST